MRVIRNAWVDDWERRPDEIKRFPEQMQIAAREGVLLLLDPEDQDPDRERACMPTGQGAGAITDIPSCAEIVDRVMREAQETIDRLAALAGGGTPAK
jgi:enoyl-[acyl-carrier protein] reductase II